MTRNFAIQDSAHVDWLAYADDAEANAHALDARGNRIAAHAEMRRAALCRKNAAESEAMRATREAGVQAERDGVKWWNNPHPSGSVEAYEWDQGHSAARRIRGAHQ